MTFKVRLWLRVVGYDQSLYINRVIHLPFVPAKEMLLSGITPRTSNVTDWPIATVRWDISDQMFDVQLENDDQNEITGEDRMTAQDIVSGDWGSEWSIYS